METTPRILIAGPQGFVGARLMARYPSAMTVEGPLLRNPGRTLEDFVKTCHPDFILNAAAISDIGTCEKDPEGSYRANVMLPVSFARVAEELGAKLISFSSDQVYTGCTGEGPYAEGDLLPEPANVYARHKLEAEQRVLDLHPQAILLRATWMYDLPMYGHRNRGNFLVNTLNALLRGASIQVSGGQCRGITYVRQVADWMDRMMALPGGVYNYGSENPLTMLDTAQALLDALGAQGTVQDVGGERHNLWMDCSKLKENGVVFDTTAEGFLRCVRDYGLK